METSDDGCMHITSVVKQSMYKHNLIYEKLPHSFCVSNVVDKEKHEKKHWRYVLIQFASIHKHKHHVTDRWYLLQFYLQLIGKFNRWFQWVNV